MDKELEEIDREFAEIKLRLSIIERKSLELNIPPLNAVGKFVWGNIKRPCDC